MSVNTQPFAVQKKNKKLRFWKEIRDFLQGCYGHNIGSGADG